jgi:hypothetical protein
VKVAAETVVLPLVWAPVSGVLDYWKFGMDLMEILFVV